MQASRAAPGTGVKGGFCKHSHAILDNNLHHLAPGQALGNKVVVVRHVRTQQVDNGLLYVLRVVCPPNERLCVLHKP